MKKKIVAFAGSTSSMSINRKLVSFVLSHLEDFDIEFLDLNDFEMPIFSVDREKELGFPEKAHQFRRHMQDADGIVCSLAEHNRSYSAAFKNVFDWCSRIDLNIFADKPMLLMSTSPGGFGGGNVMNAAKSFFPKCGASVIETFSLPSFYQNFGDDTILNEDFKNDLLSKVELFRGQL